MAKYIILLLGLFFISASYSQTDNSFRFVHIGLQEGLSQSTVVDIAQDNDGNMWFATHTA